MMDYGYSMYQPFLLNRKSPFYKRMLGCRGIRLSIFLAVLLGTGALLATFAIPVGAETAQRVSLPSDINLPAFQTDSVKKSSDSQLARSSAWAGLPRPSPQTINTLELTSLNLTRSGAVLLSALPKFSSNLAGKTMGRTERGDVVLYSIDPQLQKVAEDLVSRTRSPHVAIIAMQPDTGRVLALAQKSSEIKNFALYDGLPAASLFKLITSSAALEQGSLSGNSLIRFRGGTYRLDRGNYFPDTRRDTRSMQLADALGKSCNPVFARVALRFLSPEILQSYADAFGFNSDLQFDFPVPKSSARIPHDAYEWSRTAAGFGNIRITPLHAASLMAGIANGGYLPRPSLVDKIISSEGDLRYNFEPRMVTRIAQRATMSRLMQMMESTTTTGTSRKEFMRRGSAVISGVTVAAKTGTLSGTNPLGTNHWFVAAAPINDPRIAVAVIMVSPKGGSGYSSRLGREMIEAFYGRKSSTPLLSKKAPVRKFSGKKTNTKKKFTKKKSAVVKKTSYAKKSSSKKYTATKKKTSATTNKTK